LISLVEVQSGILNSAEHMVESIIISTSPTLGRRIVAFLAIAIQAAIMIRKAVVVLSWTGLRTMEAAISPHIGMTPKMAQMVAVTVVRGASRLGSMAAHLILQMGQVLT
jgi:hypothetical protein